MNDPRRLLSGKGRRTSLLLAALVAAGAQVPHAAPSRGPHDAHATAIARGHGVARPVVPVVS